MLRRVYWTFQPTIKSRFNCLESTHYLRAQVNHDLIVHVRRMRKALHDGLKQLQYDLIVVDVGAPQGAQLNHDLIVHVRHMGKALHDAIEQLNQDLIVLDVGGCQGAGPGQLNQELIFFNSWINCLPISIQAITPEKIPRAKP